MHTIDITLFRILGAMFYYSPETPTFQTLQPVLREIPALDSWDEPEQLTAICEALSTIPATYLTYDFSILFEGQGAMPAPPWGSVYLSHDNTVMGDSTRAYRQFLMAHGLVTDTGLREPEDQFGLMLMAISALAEQGQDDAIVELLEQHLLPWAGRYLTLVQQTQTEHDFYPQLARIAEAYLTRLQIQLGLHPAAAELFR
ncbi:Tat proofreading chaperone DmsD [Providencia alcalifaciens]|uniref:TorD/DmsD family molecular chaperone n=1 Tax=Providencia alcalifaciens TaxID=126385 RepID=UPI00044BC42C|nr:molecular chaperone [Providencia alcalifaciens]EUD02128.1 nitrate reductase delta subunit [Providencia alcalifaciens RIMD 1656011]CAG9423144.1 Tat proofreading chaperone DmsD [Providencia alcalifaciens]